MKNMNVILSALSLLTLATPAFAGHGVEKVLPADATNVAIASVSIQQVATGQTEIADGADGPVYDNTYSPALNIVVTYTSKDHSDDATALNNDSDNAQEVVVGGPTLTFNLLPVTAAQVAAINAGTLDPRTLLTLSVTQATVKFNNPEFTDSCQFDNDNGGPINPECVKNVVTTEVRPVLSIDLK
jgi:hypothetical protein